MGVSAPLIGQQLKQARLRQQRTLQEIATLCGCSRSLLCKIERGRTTPPLATLMRITGALGVSMASLFATAEACTTVFTPAAEARPPRFVRTAAGYAFFALAGARASRRMDPCLVVARKCDSPAQDLSHAGEEWLFLLEGSMRYRVGARSYDLGPGGQSVL